MIAIPHRLPPAGPPPGRRRPVPLYAPGPGGNGLHALYERLRAEYGPVAPVALAPDLHAWLVLGYREVLLLARNERDFGRDPRCWNLLREGLVPAGSPLLASLGLRPAPPPAGGRRHPRMRAAVTGALARFGGHELGRAVRAAAERLAGSFAGRREVDLVAHYARRLPLSVLALLLGADERTGWQVAEAAAGAAAVSADSPDAVRRLERLLGALIAEKRGRPGADVVSLLLAHPAALTDEEVLHSVALTAGIAHQTTRDWIASALHVLLTDSAVRSSLDDGRLTVDDVLDLVLWRFPPVQHLPARYATRDLLLGGQDVRAGDMLVLGLAAANTDPRALPRGGRPVPGNRAHTAFGAGPHACPAQAQARLIVRTAVEVLRNHLPDMELSVPQEELVWASSPWARRLAALPVRPAARRTASAVPCASVPCPSAPCAPPAPEPA
ncbi:cytochrome P450 [Streptomyces glaucosporus]|uniref:Cytochrome P450 n=1 Tax=Streptomyces glaucosporus TaxID=284044 RepID=A0ABN3HVA9_9ACTN